MVHIRLISNQWSFYIRESYELLPVNLILFIQTIFFSGKKNIKIYRCQYIPYCKFMFENVNKFKTFPSHKYNTRGKELLWPEFQRPSFTQKISRIADQRSGFLCLNLLKMFNFYQRSSLICAIIWYPNTNELPLSLLLSVSPHLVKFWWSN